MRSQTLVVFIRGFNTWGDDEFHLGPLRWAPQHHHWSQAFQQKHVLFTPLLGMGSGRIPELLDRAEAILAKILENLNPSNRVHLMGHSMGGLVARALAHRPFLQNRVDRILTIGTPHRGTPVADWALRLPVHSPHQVRIARCIGYDVHTRLQLYEDFLEERARAFNQSYPDLPLIRYASVLTSASETDQFFLLRRLRAQFQGPHDGIVPIESQSWGEVLSELNLDHVGQLGFNFSLRSEKRQKFQTEWGRLKELALHFLL